ncbi:MAG: hypothetical protein GX638_10645, partial [Crenarchaeota archaeon]|nr:hypothetical protein [Thermoproteota archaeon]
NFWTAPIPTSMGSSEGAFEPGETSSISLIMAPVGLGNLRLGYTSIGRISPSIYIPTEFVLPIHLVVISPSNVTLVDVEVVTPYTVQIDFKERGEYVVYATNIGDNKSAIPIDLNFPKDGTAMYRESDKFLVSSIFTVSGVVIFCLGLFTSMILKYKKAKLTVSKQNKKIFFCF